MHYQDALSVSLTTVANACRKTLHCLQAGNVRCAGDCQGAAVPSKVASMTADEQGHMGNCRVKLAGRHCFEAGRKVLYGLQEGTVRVLLFYHSANRAAPTPQLGSFCCAVCSLATWSLLSLVAITHAYVCMRLVCLHASHAVTVKLTSQSAAAGAEVQHVADGVQGPCKRCCTAASILRCRRALRIASMRNSCSLRQLLGCPATAPSHCVPRAAGCSAALCCGIAPACCGC